MIKIVLYMLMYIPVIVISLWVSITLINTIANKKKSKIKGAGSVPDNTDSYSSSDFPGDKHSTSDTSLSDYLKASSITEYHSQKSVKTELTIDNAFTYIQNNKLRHWKEDVIISLQSRISISELLAVKEVSNIQYKDLLSCIEWQALRLKILIRDKFMCQHCNTKSFELHVHHKLYIKDKLPWDLEQKHLISLCRDCHKREHLSKSIKTYKLIGNELFEVIEADNPCFKCKGRGFIPEFNHISGGMCFRCEGNGLERTVFTKAIRTFQRHLHSYDPTHIHLDFKQSLKKVDIGYFVEHMLSLYDSCSSLHRESCEVEDELDDLPF